MVAFPAEAPLAKIVVPKFEFVIVALPAVELSKKLVEPPSFVIVALAAVELLMKLVEPAPLPISLLMIVALAALELFKKSVELPKSLLIVCVVPELFTIPTPTRVREVPPNPVLIVKELGPLNVMELMVTLAESDTRV